MESLKQKILIVDDNPKNLQVLGKILQDENYNIEFAVDGKAALEWLKSDNFDLVLLDIMMPGMNGFEVCREIRSSEGIFSDIPVIFLTADTDRESLLKGFELGAQDYLTKPFDARELLARVSTQLELKLSRELLKEVNKLLEEKVAERTLQLKEANERLEEANARLMELDRNKSDFLNLISHEIRTPLNGILGIMEILKGPVDTGEISGLVQMLDESVRRLEQFASNALLLTTLKTKSHEIKKEKTDISELTGSLLNEEKEKIREKGLMIERKDEITPCFVSGNAELITKCLKNVLDNAIRFSPDKGVISINTYLEKQNTVCEIKDQGKGFAPEILNRSFELFTTGNEYKDKSTGLGLSISHMIMKAHEGDIILGNVPGGGASVKLLFGGAGINE